MSVLGKLFVRNRCSDDISSQQEVVETFNNESEIDGIKEKIATCKKLRNWRSLYRLYVNKGRIYEDGGHTEQSLQSYLTSYYIEMSGGVDKVGDATIDGLFQEFEPEEPENSVGKALSAVLIRNQRLRYQAIRDNIEKIVGELHSEYSFPITPKDFSLKLQKDLFSQ